MIRLFTKQDLPNSFYPPLREFEDVESWAEQGNRVRQIISDKTHYPLAVSPLLKTSWSLSMYEFDKYQPGFYAHYPVNFCLPGISICEQRVSQLGDVMIAVGVQLLYEDSKVKPYMVDSPDELFQILDEAIKNAETYAHNHQHITRLFRKGSRNVYLLRQSLEQALLRRKRGFHQKAILEISTGGSTKSIRNVPILLSSRRPVAQLRELMSA